mgnify:CR=1 FL=1
MIFDRAIRAGTLRNEGSRILSIETAADWRAGGAPGPGGAMKLSAVNRCVECLSDSMAKLPVYVMREDTKERVDHPLLALLERRPNEAMTPAVYKKLMESNRLLAGNGFALIVRNRLSARPVELLPLSPSLVQIWLDDAGHLWYLCTNPKTGERRKVIGWDVLHYKAYSSDGVSGISVISRAAEVIEAGRAQQRYERRFYGKNAQPSGVLTVDTQLEKTSKDKIREEWDRLYSGVDNSFRIAVLDLGMKYAPVSVSQKDAQFIESKAVTVEDVARFFGVPLHKLMSGKQAYNSNEQNSIEYVTGTLAPTVAQCDQEDTYKLLFDSEIKKGMRIKRNMLAELKGDTHTRAEWYRTMREIGAFSPNDIRALEDMESVPGGETRYASLNYVPLDQFSALSAARNQNGGGNKTD